MITKNTEETRRSNGIPLKANLIILTIYPSMFSNKQLKSIVSLSLWTKIFKRGLIEKGKKRFKPGMKSRENLLFTSLLLLNIKKILYV